MGIFSNIMSKLGFGHADAAPVVPTAAPVTPKVSAPAVEAAAVAQAATPTPIKVVDVVSKLEEMSSAQGGHLNWKTSIVDLMKLLGLDSSLANRKELAVELNCPAELMGDSAQMNMWLHKSVMKQIAANGGNIPENLHG